MKTEEIIQLIKDKEADHRKKYKEFCEATPGHVMNGHWIKADTCKEILELIIEEDYSQQKGFWLRLQSFVSDVYVNDAMSEEDKNMILHNCEQKLKEE